MTRLRPPLTSLYRRRERVPEGRVRAAPARGQGADMLTADRLTAMTLHNNAPKTAISTKRTSIRTYLRLERTSRRQASALPSARCRGAWHAPCAAPGEGCRGASRCALAGAANTLTASIFPFPLGACPRVERRKGLGEGSVHHPTHLCHRWPRSIRSLSQGGPPSKPSVSSVLSVAPSS